jgi:hypothetical protein
MENMPHMAAREIKLIDLYMPKQCSPGTSIARFMAIIKILSKKVKIALKAT